MSRRALCNLRQINLVAPMLVAQPVLHPGRLRRTPRGTRHLFEVLNAAVPIHLEVNADPAVEREIREVQAHVRDARLDNLADNLIRLLIVRDPDLDAVALSGDGLSNAHRQGPVAHRGGQFEELVDLVAVAVFDGQSRPRQGGVGDFVRRMGLLDLEVEELVERLVLQLRHAGPEAEPVAAVVEHALGVHGEVDALIRRLVDQHAEFGFDFELDAAALDLAHVFVEDDVLEQKVGDRLGELLLRNRVGDAGLPGPQQSPLDSSIRRSAWCWRDRGGGAFLLWR